MLDRHQVRQLAFQALFMLSSNKDLEVETAVSVALTTAAEHDGEVAEGTVKLNLNDENQAYLQTIVTGIVSHQDELDELLVPKLKSGWTLKRLSKTDHLILRLGLYEIQYQSEIPNAVAINEAIQLAKEFSDDQSSKFINAVLASFVKTTPVKPKDN